MSTTTTSRATQGPALKIVITHRCFPETETQLWEAGHDLVINKTDSSWPRDKVIEELSDADAMIAFMPDQIDAGLLDACPSLSIVAGAFKGPDNVDIAACTERGVWVTVVPDTLTVPTAELAMGLALALARNLGPGDATMRQGGFTGWRPLHYGLGLGEATIGLIGFGKIGRALAERLKPFGARCLMVDPEPVAQLDAPVFGVEPVSFDHLLRNADLMFLSTPLLSETARLIDATAIAKMKPGSLLVNVGRGSTVDELAVADALHSGQLGGYAADVFACEDLSLPNRPDGVPDALLAAPRTFFTPHLGSATVKARQLIETIAGQNIMDFHAGRTPRNAINAPQTLRARQSRLQAVPAVAGT